MKRVLLDTSVIIDHLKGHEPATNYLVGLEEGALLGIVSSITHTELLAGERMTAAEQAQIEMVLRLVETIDVTPKIAYQAGLLLARFRRSHGLAPFDAIIAATAMALGVPLSTRNVKDFRFIPDLTATSPY